MAIIDTSASMTEELLSHVDAELSRLARQYTVVVVECDASIQRVYPYRRLGFFRGRGGTDFRPPLEPAFLRQHRPDLIVFFSDGDGPTPEAPPRRPVIWCLTPGGQAPVTWGRFIWMDGRDED
jgi:predicted metal-dependent peptidase